MAADMLERLKNARADEESRGLIRYLRSSYQRPAATRRA